MYQIELDDAFEDVLEDRSQDTPTVNINHPSPVFSPLPIVSSTMLS